MTVLRNDVTEIDGLQVAGLGDYWSPDFRHAGTTLERLDRPKATIVLCHNPDAVDEPIWGDLQGWVLAGHTHGGQCKPPFLPPPLLPVRNRHYTAGTFAVGGGRTLYINRGLRSPDPGAVQRPARAHALHAGARRGRC